MASFVPESLFVVYAVYAMLYQDNKNTSPAHMKYRWRSLAHVLVAAGLGLSIVLQC